MRRTESAAGGLALALALLHLAWAPRSGTDLAAQVARASFAKAAPFTPVDFSWYGGMHPFSYSVLAPWVMAWAGVALTGVVAAVAGSMLLARLLRDCARPWSATLVGTVFVVANVVSGRTTFALGLVAALAALLALPSRPRAAVCAVLTALLSPVAAAFLGLVAAVLVLHRRPGGFPLGLGAAVPVLLLAWLFPGGGIQPFSGSSARPAVAVAVMLAVLTANPLVRTGALLWGAAVLVFVNHDDPFGSNVLRLGLLLAATVLLASAVRRPVLVLAATLGFLSWQIGPPHGDLKAPVGPPTGGLVRALQDQDSRRAEVLAPRDHREAADVARYVPLARGWSRQLDYVENPLFYKGTLTATDFLTWLRANAVDHVAAPVAAELDFGSTREGALLGGPVAGLTPVWQDAHWVLYEVSDPIPIAAAPATVLASTRTELAFAVSAAGRVPVQLRWSRWLTVAEGDACLERDGDQATLRVRSAGQVVLSSSLRPQGHCSSKTNTARSVTGR